MIPYLEHDSIMNHLNVFLLIFFDSFFFPKWYFVKKYVFVNCEVQLLEKMLLTDRLTSIYNKQIARG